MGEETFHLSQQDFSAQRFSQFYRFEILIGELTTAATLGQIIFRISIIAVDTLAVHFPFPRLWANACLPKSPTRFPQSRLLLSPSEK